MGGKLLGVEGDADGNALHHLDPVAGGVLRRQQREGGAGAGPEAGQGAGVFDLLAVHVGGEVDRLADAHVAQLRFLEIGIDPDLVEGDDRHHRRPGLDPLADLDAALGHVATDRRRDVAALQGEIDLTDAAAAFWTLGWFSTLVPSVSDWLLASCSRAAARAADAAAAAALALVRAVSACCSSSLPTAPVDTRGRRRATSSSALATSAWARAISAWRRAMLAARVPLLA